MSSQYKQYNLYAEYYFYQLEGFLKRRRRGAWLTTKMLILENKQTHITNIH